MSVSHTSNHPSSRTLDPGTVHLTLTIVTEWYTEPPSVCSYDSILSFDTLTIAQTHRQDIEDVYSTAFVWIELRNKVSVYDHDVPPKLQWSLFRWGFTALRARGHHEELNPWTMDIKQDSHFTDQLEWSRHPPTQMYRMWLVLTPCLG